MWTYNSTDELYHHGVKGMKWGVRRNLEETYGKRGERTPEQKARVRRAAAIAAGTAVAAGAAIFAASPYGRQKISEVANTARISAGKRRASKMLNSGHFTDVYQTNNGKATRYSYTDKRTGITAHQMINTKNIKLSDGRLGDSTTWRTSFSDSKNRGKAIRDSKWQISNHLLPNNYAPTTLRNYRVAERSDKVYSTVRDKVKSSEPNERRMARKAKERLEGTYGYYSDGRTIRKNNPRWL